MAYRQFCIITSLIVLFLVSGITGSGAAELKTISEGGITVYYPDKYESQAKSILQKYVSTVKPCLDIQNELIQFLDNRDKLAEEIANLLGAEEKKDEAVQRLKAYQDKSKVLARCFSNIKLVETSDAVVSNGVKAGLFKLGYNKNSGEFFPMLDYANATENKLAETYFIVLINADGSIRGENKITELALSIMGSSKAIIIAPIHETVGYLIAEELKLYHPFTRWFNEGVSGWVTRRVVTKLEPKYTGLVNELIGTASKYKHLQDKVNLISWPQGAFQISDKGKLVSELEAAKALFAVELISNILGKNGDSLLPKIMSLINYNPDADTDTICQAVQKITKKDCKAMLMAYVPNSLKSLDSSKLIAQAEEFARQKKWKEAVDKLRTALEIDPLNVNARINLAWLEREIKDNLSSEMNIFISARLLKQGLHNYKSFVPAVENYYVLGRLSILFGDIEGAKKYLDTVIELKPDHKDAKRALDQIKAMQNTLKGK